ncbi:hypothetical protein DPEC_G00276060 [Dallia pectoralis]|uniref:Uncharacterized protein n=1 Tax=Dallia pectoralis TaxID=75939 RepID=A0ACC2FLF9_DALPE|nr:hypothetical protein DPEC_G00276060 [Dallia pectoralis]
MRRKTIAKRILDPEYDEEEEEEDPTYEDFTTTHGQHLCHRLQKRRKHAHPEKENREEKPPCSAPLQKFRTRAPDLDNSNVELMEDGYMQAEGVGGLQSRSKADLVAMVLGMQKEMDSLREQIRCLTACGKLARNLEALVERTEVWPGHTPQRARDTPPSPIVPEMLVRSGPTTTSTLLASPGALNGRWTPKLEPPQHNGYPRGSHEGSSQINSPPLYQEFITAELLDRCNTGTTAQKLTNDLLRGLYERDCLASHSISGIVNNKRGQPKPALPADDIQAILRAVQHFFPGKTDSEVKGYIRQKLQNEAKRLRKKPHLAVKAEPETGSEGAETSVYT